MDMDSEFSLATSLMPANQLKPTNDKLPIFKTPREIKKALKEQRDKIARFVEQQMELAKAEAEREQAENPGPEAVTDVEEILRVERQRLREKLMDDGIKEHQRTRKEKWERAMSNELYLLNDIKREQIFDHKLKNPMPIFDSNSEQKNDVNEKPATIGDLKLLVSQKMPRTDLDELLTQPMLNWNLCLMPKKPNMVEELCGLFRQNIGASLAVIVDGKKLYCHSMLLGLVSAFFHHRDLDRVLYLPELKIPARSFVNVYRWMVEPIRSINLDQLVDLLCASKFLAINDLNRQCWRLAHDVLKTPDRVLTIYTAAQKVCTHIERIIIPYVGRVWLPYAASRDFTHLTFKKVRRLLQLDCLAVNSEMEVFYTAIVWLQADWQARKSFAIDLMRVVRFDLMPFVFLLAFERRTDGPEAMRYLQESMIVRKLIFMGLDDIRSRNDRTIGSTGSTTRDWIYDPGCPYHHSKFCPAVRYASFSEFTNYMRALQDTGYPNGLRIKRISDKDIVCC